MKELVKRVESRNVLVSEVGNNGEMNFFAFVDPAVRLKMFYMFSKSQLSEEQVNKLKGLVSAGGQLNDLQKHIQQDFGMNITYMETRFLFSDLEIEVKSPEKPVEKKDEELTEPLDENDAIPTGMGVKVVVDQVTRAGAMVSGSVQWSDGQSSHWYLDEMGRLGLDSDEPGYQPSPSDAEEFQLALRSQLGG